jgi:hypothetical protein
VGEEKEKTNHLQFLNQILRRAPFLDMLDDEVDKFLFLNAEVLLYFNVRIVSHFHRFFQFFWGESGRYLHDLLLHERL